MLPKGDRFLYMGVIIPSKEWLLGCFMVLELLTYQHNSNNTLEVVKKENKSHSPMIKVQDPINLISAMIIWGDKVKGPHIGFYWLIQRPTRFLQNFRKYCKEILDIGLQKFRKYCKTVG
jgi:hypothetical protein